VQILSGMNRLINLPIPHSFFLFGARGTGKTWTLKKRLPEGGGIYIDLLLPEDYERFSQRPSSLSETIQTLPEKGEFWLVIDEVQKVPALLDMVHLEIEAHKRSQMGVTKERPPERKIYFALTGSSARKLKRGNANLLAGRAFLMNLYPLTHLELGNNFDLHEVLRWGSLPGIITEEQLDIRNQLLLSYIHTYLKEEILEEQLAREAPPFRRFLESAAQTNGEIINFSAIGRDVNISSNTVQSYYQILEDTLLGYYVLPYHTSIRKRQRKGPKMYLFDCGVCRALLGLHTQAVTPANYGYGKVFEHFIFLEMYRLASYNNKQFSFYYLRTKEDLEIDFIIERPGMPLALVEVKSTENVQDQHLRGLKAVKKDFPNAELFLVSREKYPRLKDGIQILPWKEAMEAIGVV
jgi:uncharacterized protein